MAFNSCSEYNISSAIATTFKNKKTNISPVFKPFVRIWEMSKVAKSDICKFTWDIKSPKGELWAKFVEISLSFPNKFSALPR